MEEEADEVEGKIIKVYNYYPLLLLRLAYSHSQTHVAFSDHLVNNSTQLQYRYLFS